MLDVVIRGGTLVDGSSAPPRRADVAIAADRIEAVEPLPQAEAARVIDATGHVVAPGFVDMHSHADFVLPGLPTADSKVHQGFTLEVVGTCGASPAPLTAARRQDVIDTALTVPPLRWDWTTFRSYLELLSREGLVVDLLRRSRLPAIFPAREYVELGGLMSYGPSTSDVQRRMAGTVDRLMRGAKVAELPMEQPTRFELVINAKTAKALGLTIPQSLLLRADEVIR